MCDAYTLFSTGVIISLEMSNYTVLEGENVSVCANLTAGVSDKVLTLNVTTEEGTANGVCLK